MFIDVTRYGGLRMLRLSVAAIAYLDTVEGGTAIHLVGGETLRVNEDPAEIEHRLAGDRSNSPDDAPPMLVSELLVPAFSVSAEEVRNHPVPASSNRSRGRRR